MTLRFRSILYAGLCGSPAVSNHLSLRLYLRPWLSPCKYSQQQLQKPRYQQHIRWLSTEGDVLGSRGFGSPGPSGVSNGPPPLPEFRNLPSQKESRRPNLIKKFSAAMDHLQTAMFTAGQKLNEITGYSEIEALKKSIEQQESHVNASRQAVQSAKEQYQAAIKRRSASQREVNEMALRRHVWEPSDLERFTELYRSDHANEQAEVSAHEHLAHAERVADEAQAGLARSILSRYHEEQIWSDKIRRASTWGTWGLMSFNVLLFIVVQLGLEPWKRRRLVGGFEEKVREIVQEESLKRNALPTTHVREGGSEGEGGGGYMAAPGPSSEEIAETTQGPESTAFESQDPIATAIAIDALETTTEESHVGESHIVREEATEATAEENHLDKDDQPWLEHLREGAADKARDLFSERVVSMRQVDLTSRVLGGMAFGAVIAVTISLLTRQ